MSRIHHVTWDSLTGLLTSMCSIILLVSHWSQNGYLSLKTCLICLSPSADWHKDAPWKWSQEEEEAFVKIKKAVSTPPVLKFFTPSKPTEGGDTSEKGIGFVRMQKGQPVTYASRTLTKAEENYSQIEKELLAQVFSMEHNHQYVHGRRVACGQTTSH